MKTVFMTGASGFIGQAVAQELVHHGYKVIGLTRSEAGVQQLRALGVEACFGDIHETASWESAVSRADAVIHTAFNHDFSTFLENCQDDYQLIQTLGQLLKGSDRPLLVTSGAFFTGRERNTPVEHALESTTTFPRALSDESAWLCAEQGVKAMVVGLTQVHNRHRFGLISYLFDIAKQTSMSAYVDPSDNLWAGVHLSDAATLYRLVLERGVQGEKYIAAAEENISLYRVAQAVGDRLSLPVTAISPQQAEAHFQWLAHLVQADLNASALQTRQQLGWTPSGPDLFDDLAKAVLS
ncbi:SDR family oxidoreductase [Gynuella sp.]|uniref:SDR family oxidoreductase n=1 Tax=Gynuella sp. TaxID=2969146 RepID=UPI003D0BD05A